MRNRSIAQTAMWGVVVAVAALAFPSLGRASFVVNPGWDLFQTLSPGTTFGGVQFQGVPLNTFNFGGVIGNQNVDGTDTIIQRQAAAVAPGGVPGTAPPIPIQMLALQLMSTTPTAVFGPLDTYFITLQSVRTVAEGGAGPNSLGTMTITFGPEAPIHGTFTSSLDVFFDIRKGALNGPMTFSSDLVLQSSGTSWSHLPPSGAVQINGVNKMLNGTDTSRDFWPVPPFVESHPTGAQHTVVETGAVPEPSSLVLSALVALGIGGFCWRHRAQAVAHKSET